ncbi:hypothetical protein [Octadecabacter ascidiaceicola]|uniref:Uncharacterized protein n=1 Tax=Octadecabacter ascidiaceicola TaxID=1655543 RepID=A0A238K9T7_9RHOB|nr:hypothetical protein [Octadecabacter ascidiaceicola]SMX39583.1 hypothetical protein OCA8868_02028 [Octadecabacter ascidiaceicola]
MLIDLVAQLPQRSGEEVDRFLSLFSGEFVPSADDFACYFDKSPEPELFDTYLDAIVFLTSFPTAFGAIYLRNLRAKGLARHLFVSFAKDGSIFGGASAEEHDVDEAQQLFRQNFDSNFLVGIECYPPESAADFKKLLQA